VRPGASRRRRADGLPAGRARRPRRRLVEVAGVARPAANRTLDWFAVRHLHL